MTQVQLMQSLELIVTFQELTGVCKKDEEKLLAGDVVQGQGVMALS